MKYQPSFEYFGNTEPVTPETDTDEASALVARQTEHDKKKKPHDKKQLSKDEQHKKEKKVSHNKEKSEKSVDKKLAKPVEKIKEKPETIEEKRSGIIERSLQFKKLYEDVPIPRNPQIVAQLLVAEHILALHEKIEQPNEPQTHADKQSLLLAFDTMGELADKLENPESESTPEIQEAYETVLQLAETALAEDEPQTIINANVTLARTLGSEMGDTAKPEQTIKMRPDITSSPAVATLINLILNTRTGSAHTAHAPHSPIYVSPSPIHGSGAGSFTSRSPIRPETTQPAVGARTASPSATPQIHLSPSMSPVEARAAYHQATQLEHSMPLRLGSPNRIASLAVATAFAALHGEASHSRSSAHSPVEPVYKSSTEFHSSPATPSHTPPIREQLVANTYAQAAPAASYADHFQPPSSPAARRSFESSNHQETRSNQSASPESGRKIEHLPLHTLLSMAEAVPIGYGQRLRTAYEKGSIDKEGLVKILKSRSKNQDFIQEYRQQTTRRRNLLKASPEFLKSASSNDTPSILSSDSSDTGDSPKPIPQEPKILPFLPVDLQNVLSSTQPLSPSPGFDNVPPAKTPWLPIIGTALFALGAGVLIYFLLAD